MAIIKEDWSPEAREAAANARKGGQKGPKDSGWKKAEKMPHHASLRKHGYEHRESEWTAEGGQNHTYRNGEHHVRVDGNGAWEHWGPDKGRHGEGRTADQLESHLSKIHGTKSESTQPLLKALLEHDFKTAQKLFARLMAGRARKAMYELQVYTGRRLQEGMWDDNKNELKDRIKSTITQLKKEGTLRMAATNLKAVVSTRGLSFANPNAFERAFDDACEELKKTSPAFGKFIMESAIQEEWSEESRKAATEARKGEHPSYQQGHKDYTSNNRESPKDLNHQSRQKNSTFSKMYQKHVGAKGSVAEKVEAGGHYRRGWNDAYESHVGDLKREMESAEKQKPAHTRSLDEDWSPEAREAAAKARGPHEGFHKVLTQHGYEHKGTTMFDRSKGPKTQAAHLYQHSTEHRPSIRTTSRAWHTGTSVKGTTPETLQAHLSQKHGDK